jgi:hypothetical protein
MTRGSRRFCGDLVESIKESDPEDRTGFQADLAKKEKMAKFQEELNSFVRKRDHEGALAAIEAAREIDPAGALAARLDGFKAQITRMKERKGGEYGSAPARGS